MQVHASSIPRINIRCCRLSVIFIDVVGSVIFNGYIVCQ